MGVLIADPVAVLGGAHGLKQGGAGRAGDVMFGNCAEAGGLRQTDRLKGGLGVGDIASFHALTRIGAGLALLVMQTLAAPFALALEYLVLGHAPSGAQVAAAARVKEALAALVKDQKAERMYRGSDNADTQTARSRFRSAYLAGFREALADPNTVLVAHNSHFDRTMIEDIWNIHLPMERWYDTMAQALAHGLAFYLARYRRPDGFFRTLVGSDGAPLDDKVDLYDQAFGLFGLAMASQALPEREDLPQIAVELRDALYGSLKHPVAGFEESVPRTLPLLSNPHMHLFEASLAWIEAGGDARWREMADEIAELALVRGDILDIATLARPAEHDGADRLRARRGPGLHLRDHPGAAGRVPWLHDEHRAPGGRHGEAAA